MKTLTALLATSALALGACGSSNDNASSSSTSAAATTTTTTAASSTGSGGGSEQTVQMRDNSFGPNSITGAPGSTVKVELKNIGHNQHNFIIDSQKVDADVAPGEDAKVTVTIPKSGSVQFYCEYHKGLGMVGTVKAS